MDTDTRFLAHTFHMYDLHAPTFQATAQTLMDVGAAVVTCFFCFVFWLCYIKQFSVNHWDKSVVIQAED